MTDFGCVKCGDKGWAEHVELSGGVHTRLCNACRTEWTKVCRNSEAWKDGSAVSMAIDCLLAKAQGSGEDVTEEATKLNAKQDANRDKLYALANEWLAKKTEKPVEKPAATE